MMLPIDMIHAHRYADALAVYEDRLGRHPNDNGSLAGHAIALQCMGRYERALEEFKRANLVATTTGTRTPHYLQRIGGLEWILGQREEAMLTFKSGVDGILDGSIQFGDMAGGMSHGLLLWFTGMCIPDRGAADYAHNFLLKLCKHSKSKSWPGPIGHFILGRKGQDDVLSAACETPTPLDKAIAVAKTDLLVRRHLVQALFYFAVKHRAEGREEEYRKEMKRCAYLENPIIEIEWFLAKHEAILNSTRQP